MRSTTPPQPGRRLAVFGVSGCGKTYVAKRLAEILGVTYICNDSIYWRPDWGVTPLDQRLAEYDRATRAVAWSFDGNVDGRVDKGPLILQRADTLVWLDLPRREVFWQVFRRSLRRVWTKEPMWHNNCETWRGSFFSRRSILWLSMRAYGRRRERYTAFFADPDSARLQCIRLTCRAGVDRWLASLGGTSATSRGAS